MLSLEALFQLLPHLTEQEHRIIGDAYYFAEEAHRPQLRKSGEPYFVHVAAVAGILANLGMDTPTIVAGLLHDVVEDTNVSYHDIRALYGDEVAQLVDGVTKVDQLTAAGQTLELTEAEYLRKTISAMNDDVRVIIIKLADRLHNMRTLGSLKPHRQVEIATETLDLFAPLASRLGIWEIKSELETLSFQYIDPQAYMVLSQRAAESDRQLEPYFERLAQELQQQLQTHHINAIIKRHQRNLYTIYQEMNQRHISFEKTYGVRSIRILVENTMQCYQTLGIVHQIWKPIPGEMQDHIATPKDNFYQSLHTAVYREGGASLRVQIRTFEMEDQANYGIVSVWRQRSDNGGLQEKLTKRLAYLKELIEPAHTSDDPETFLRTVIENIDSSRIYIRTPRGDVIDLPRFATPIDFAYHIHTEVGHHCRAARVNGRLTPLDYLLQNNDEVEIYTTKRGGGPLLEWLDERMSYVCTNRAKSKMRAWFRAQPRHKLIAIGQPALEKKLQHFGLPSDNLEALRQESGYPTVEDMLAAIGMGQINAGDLVTQMVEKMSQPPSHTSEAQNPVIVGASGYKVRLARCCRPTYGDPIVGYINREAKLAVHKIDCPVLNKRPDIASQLIPIYWGQRLKPRVFPVPVELRTLDRAGIMGDIGATVAHENINMSQVNILTQNGYATFRLTMEVDSYASLSRLLTKIQALEGVLEVRRLASA